MIRKVKLAVIDPELKSCGDVDTSLVTLKFSNCTLGAIDNSRQAVYGYDQRSEVFCLNGVAKAENEIEHTTIKGNPDGFHSARIPHFFMQRYAPSYVEEVRQFIQCVREDLPTPTSGKDGRMAVVLGHATRKSLRENHPVHLSEFEK